MPRQPFLVFGRDDSEEGEDAPWWPLWASDGPQLAESAEEAIARVWEQVLLQEETHWTEFAAVPAFDWTTVMRGDPPS